jgi:uncharacterized protein (DUF58 family)
MSSDPSTNRQKFLDPKVLEQLGNMQIRAQTLVEGIISGMHRSPHRGGSIEFAEYIEYSPGHEIRHIDWKVYGKSDKYYVKQYQDETNLRAYLVLDGSGSMNFASDEAEITKLRYASFLAATLAYLFLRQGDAVGAITVDDARQTFIKASSKSTHMDDIFHLLEHLPGDGQTSLEDALQGIAERARPRSLILVFSDLLDVSDDALTLLRVMRKRNYEMALFHVVDPAEVTLPYEGMTLFEDLETPDELLVDPDDLREAYLQAIHDHFERVEGACAESNIPYFRFLTNEPIEQVVLDYLRRRAA